MAQTVDVGTEQGGRGPAAKPWRRRRHSSAARRRDHPWQPWSWCSATGLGPGRRALRVVASRATRGTRSRRSPVSPNPPRTVTKHCHLWLQPGSGEHEDRCTSPSEVRGSALTITSRSGTFCFARPAASCAASSAGDGARPGGGVIATPRR
jgi:hypothetical protein